MATIVIVGDGPGGLSAALFLARAGHSVTVFGTDQTALHAAYLNNYLGIPAISGSEFHRVAREQAAAAGADLRHQRVTSLTPGDQFAVETDAGDRLLADYLVLTEGRKPELANALGLERTHTGIAVDAEYRSSLDRVYVVGRSARPKRSQVIISAGAGATAALDILSREAGKDVQDWDTPPKA